ncbi:MAG: pectate lyase-like adhesive domain-containing protein [Verrucomicrobiota bacterium]
MVKKQIFVLTAITLAATTPRLGADTTVSVSTLEELNTAIRNASEQPTGNGVHTINFSNDLTYTGGILELNLFTNATSGNSILIDGGGFTLDLGNNFRGFFIAGGDVLIRDLEIANAVAVGGNGNTGGGGGMGAGGGLFVVDGSSIAGSGITEETSVTLENVSFTGNQAIGGNALNDSGTSNPAGGGGGLGGDGGDGFNSDSVLAQGAGGGGGVGIGATGGDADDGFDNPGGEGTFLTASGGGSSNTGQPGGPSGGGGGGAYTDSLTTITTAGGGGIGGSDASNDRGGDGGWGGGGGGSFEVFATDAGDGGWGGGGGSSAEDASGGDGGFGGGAGGGLENGDRGFGGGDAGSIHGGGGLGAGGAIFAMKGVTLIIDGVSFSNNSTSGGTSSDGGDGLGIGNDVFFGSDVVFQIGSGETLIVAPGSFGGAASSGAGNDPNDDAKGRLTVTGGGEMVIQGAQSFAGTTFVDGSIYTLAAADSEPQGTSGTSDYQVFNPGAILNINSAGAAIAPITQTDGIVNIIGDGNTIAANSFTPGSIVDMAGVSGGVFIISGNNTTLSGTSKVSGGAEMNIIGQGTEFSQQITVDDGQLHITGLGTSFNGMIVQAGLVTFDAESTMNGLLVQGGEVRVNSEITFSGALNVSGGTFRVTEMFKPTNGATLAFTGGLSELVGGDNGGANTYLVADGGEAAFGGNFDNSTFISEAPSSEAVSTLRFIGGSALPELATTAASIEIREGAGVYFDFSGDVGEIIGAVQTQDLTLYTGTTVTFDLFSTDTIPVIMDSPTGALTFEKGFADTIEFVLGEFGDSLGIGESRTYTIIGSVTNLDIEGFSDIFSALVFDNGGNTGIEGTFSGLDADSDPNLHITLTNTIPEPGQYPLVLGIAALAWIASRRRRPLLSR